MKKLINVIKFFATDYNFLFSLLLTIIFGAVAAVALKMVFTVGFDVILTSYAVVFSSASVFIFFVGIKECAALYKGQEIKKYYQHINNMVESGEWARI